MWIRKTFLEHQKQGLLNVINEDLCLHDLEYFFESFRMSPTTFELLLF